MPHRSIKVIPNVWDIVNLVSFQNIYSVLTLDSYNIKNERSFSLGEIVKKELSVMRP